MYAEEGTWSFPLRVFSCSVMEHEQQFKKMWWLVLRISEETCASIHNPRLVAVMVGQLASGWELANEQFGKNGVKMPISTKNLPIALTTPVS